MEEFYRVEIENDRGTYECSYAGQPWSGFSRQPLLDACRRLKRMGASDGIPVRLYWRGMVDWSLQATVGGGAAISVQESDKSGPRFTRYKPSPYA